MNDKYQTIKIRKETRAKLKVLAAQRGMTMMDLIDKLAEGQRIPTALRERTLIAHLQVLIGSHRHPGMYRTKDAIEAAEDAWEKANKELLEEGL
jgi:hypothetical protein